MIRAPMPHRRLIGPPVNPDWIAVLSLLLPLPLHCPFIALLLLFRQPRDTDAWMIAPVP
jgi:hypothetical protein